MIMAKEQAFLKAQEQFDNLKNRVELAARDGHRIDTIERDLMRQLLGLGHTLLTAFVAQQGDGDQGPSIEPEEGPTLQRLPTNHDRRYLSIFGELTISRVVYGTREGQKIQRVPLDERLGLPENSFSYVLENWSQRLCLKESFAEASNSLEMLLGLRLGSRRHAHLRSIAVGRSGGNGRHNTACTTLKMAVFAPMPNASVRPATVEKPGLLKSMSPAYAASRRHSERPSRRHRPTKRGHCWS